MSTQRPALGPNESQLLNQQVAAKLSVEELGVASASTKQGPEQSDAATVKNNFEQFLAGNLDIRELDPVTSPIEYRMGHQDNHWDYPDPWPPDGHTDVHDEFTPIHP
jgi:hypothetical protein